MEEERLSVKKKKLECEVREKEIKKTFLQKDGPGRSHYIFGDTLAVQL